MSKNTNIFYEGKKNIKIFCRPGEDQTIDIWNI
jgi:hypothetical protein